MWRRSTPDIELIQKKPQEVMKKINNWYQRSAEKEYKFFEAEAGLYNLQGDVQEIRQSYSSNF